MTYIYTLAKGSGDRTKSLLVGSGMATISNVVSIITRLGLIALLTRIYTKDEFGLWVSITSITAVMAYSDFGVGCALRNKLIESRIKENNDHSGREYFFSVVYFFLVTAITISLALFFLRDYIPYDHLFKTDDLALKAESRYILLCVPSLLLLNIPLGIGPMMFYAYEETNIASLINIGIFIVTSLVIGIAALLNQSITVTTILYFLVNLLCITSGTLYFIYRRKWFSLRVNIKLIASRVWRLLREGMFFAILQISGTFLFNAVTLITTSQIGLAAASELNLVQKMYVLGLGVWMGFYNPLWAGFADAMNRNDWNWCKVTITRVLYTTTIVFAFATLIFTFYGNYFLKLLAGKGYVSSKLLLLSMGAWTLFYLLYTMSLTFLSATGKTKWITLLSTLSVLFIYQTAPYFAQEYGTIGVTSMSAFIFLLLGFAAYTQSFYMINYKANFKIEDSDEEISLTC